MHSGVGTPKMHSKQHSIIREWYVRNSTIIRNEKSTRKMHNAHTHTATWWFINAPKIYIYIQQIGKRQIIYIHTVYEVRKEPTKSFIAFVPFELINEFILQWFSHLFNGPICNVVRVYIFFFSLFFSFLLVCYSTRLLTALLCTVHSAQSKSIYL